MAAIRNNKVTEGNTKTKDNLKKKNSTKIFSIKMCRNKVTL